ELSNLGVRVSNLENKVGNITWTGDARVKYEHRDAFIGLKDGDPNHQFEPETDSYTARMRLNLKAQASDKIAVKARLVSNFDFVDAKDNGKISVDRLHAEYTPVKGFTIDAGRTNLTLGTGAWYDDTFDGVIVSQDLGKYNVQAGYGRYRAFTFVKEFAYTTKNGPKSTKKFNLISKGNNEAWFAQAGVRVNDKVQLGSFFTHFAKSVQTDPAEEFVGFNGKVQLNKALSLEGDYVRNISKPADADHDARFWTVGATYDMGMAQLGLHYYDVEAGSYLDGSGAAINDKLGGIVAEGVGHGSQSWVASAKVAVAKDVTLNANYKFNSKTQSFKTKSLKDEERSNYNDIWNVSLNYVF
ncbi:porin, partial [Dialister micraerophilus]|uniref:porin n=1 Tax=Dialister micraerophilus TaxID=309120 RepID=UPI0023F2FAD3